MHVGAKQESLGVYASSLGITGKYLVKTVAESNAESNARRVDRGPSLGSWFLEALSCGTIMCLGLCVLA